MVWWCVVRWDDTVVWSCQAWYGHSWWWLVLFLLGLTRWLGSFGWCVSGGGTLWRTTRMWSLLETSKTDTLMCSPQSSSWRLSMSQAIDSNTSIIFCWQTHGSNQPSGLISDTNQTSPQAPTDKVVCRERPIMAPAPALPPHGGSTTKSCSRYWYYYHPSSRRLLASHETLFLEECSTNSLAFGAAVEVAYTQSHIQWGCIQWWTSGAVQ